MIDTILLILLGLGIFLGYKRGFISSLFSLVGTFVVIIIAYYLKNPIGELLYNTFPFINFDGVFKGVTSLNILFYQGIAFILCYIILRVLLKVLIKISKFFEKIISQIAIVSLVSKILGIIVSVIEVTLYAYVVLLVLLLIPKTNPSVVESKVGMYILNDLPILSNVTSNLTNASEEIYNICSDKKIDDKDLKTLEILIKNGIIDKDEVNKLIDENKLKIDNIGEVLTWIGGNNND